MKKTTLALTVASVFTSGVFAGEYGFRDFLVNQNTKFMSINETSTVLTSNSINDIGTYCVIQGGNIEGSVTTRLGTSGIKLYTDDEINKLQSMSKSERIAKYGSSFNRNFNQEFTDKLKTYDMDDKFECKLPSGQIAFSALKRSAPKHYAWIVEHSKESMEDNAYYAVFTGNKDANFMGYTTRKGRSTEIKKTLNSEYPTYTSLFNDWQNGFMDRAKKTKQGDNYEFNKTFMFGYSSDLASMMNELEETQYFCEAKNGEFLKDGKSFRGYIKDFYLTNRGVNKDTFRGTYVCQNTPEAFTLTLDNYMPKNGDQNNFYMSDAVIKKGANSTAKIVSTMRNTVAEKGMTPFEMGLVYQAVTQKSSIARKNGLALETAVYEGKDSSGCDLAYIEKHIVTIPNSSETFKYKSCNGEISLRN